MLEYIILGFLMKKEMSGYDLKQWMTHSTSYFFDASFGSIYPALKRLEEKGYICFQEVMEGNKFKKMYAITGEGKKHFLSWLEKPIVFAKTKSDHLVPIFFYKYLPRETAVVNLKAFIKEVEPLLERLSEQKFELEKVYPIDQLRYENATMTYGIYYYQFVIEWCKDLLKQIEGERE
ncbi:MAG: PadR-family transcriptional regulator [Clostridia bacterium]|jgi:DNA-binding PadR family transcriptional regulator|nr:PadR-family transcriptional regulator [Clostridia bacterium]